MKIHCLTALALVLFVAACGVKNDLGLPSGADAPEGEIDPSLPPQPLGM
jgi:hypothetical protein